MAETSDETPWSEAFVAGLAFYILGGLLGSFVLPPFPGFVLSVVFFVVGFAVSWRSTYQLRDIGAYCLLTLVSVSVVINLVEAASGQPSPYEAGGALLILTIIVVALAGSLGLLTALRRWKRVPQFG